MKLSTEDLLEPEDIATDLDAPAPLDLHGRDGSSEETAPREQLEEVTPQIDASDESAEPKPGC